MLHQWVPLVATHGDDGGGDRHDYGRAYVVFSANYAMQLKIMLTAGKMRKI